MYRYLALGDSYWVECSNMSLQDCDVCDRSTNQCTTCASGYYMDPIYDSWILCTDQDQFAKDWVKCSYDISTGSKRILNI